jgi:short-subunit dehydrogenase
MKKTVAIFGASGGIGAATRQQFLDAGYTVIPVSRNLIDFSSSKADEQIQEFLSLSDPDIIVNCTGYFAGNDEPAEPTMSVNFNSNWSLVRHYFDKTNRETKIIMVGSSACRGGRKNYIVYGASKAALLSMWEGCRDALANTKVTVNLVNPVRVRTNMVAPFDDNLDYLDPNAVAYEILQLAKTSASSCVEMTFKEL